jgi:hypothetical protein
MHMQRLLTGLGINREFFDACQQSLPGLFKVRAQCFTLQSLLL